MAIGEIDLIREINLTSVSRVEEYDVVEQSQVWRRDKESCPNSQMGRETLQPISLN